MTKKILLHLFNILSSIMPFTSFFRMKSFLAIKAGINVGDNVRICGRTYFFGSGVVSIGDNTWIGLNNSFYRTNLAFISVGDNCDIGPEVKFVTGSHQLGDSKRRAGTGTGGSITIGNGCWIGACVTILGNVEIGEGVVVAAGSVVTTDVPKDCLVAGVPAVVKKNYPTEV